MSHCVALPWVMETGSLPPRAGAGRGGPGCFILAVAAAGRDRCCLDRSRPCKRQVLRAPLPGNPRCCCVRVCQSPVLTGALAGGVPSSRPRGVPLQEVAAGESAV